jgi:hypothetical protein
MAGHPVHEPKEALPLCLCSLFLDWDHLHKAWTWDKQELEHKKAREQEKKGFEGHTG